MRRFLLLALPLLVLAMALFHFTLEAFGRAPELAQPMPQWLTLGTWCLEAVGLAALFLLIHGRGNGRWLSGLLTGWIAWVFRGPLLVLAVVSFGGLAPGPWWALAFSWWVLYSLCGLLLGGVAAAAGLQA
ncbi:MAG TPA: hypothetical protein VMW27_30840 [Thermoanaerobaculia bacterium]|nr:hypothetical protein [Thermoanaerobaculia bacterium]